MSTYLDTAFDKRLSRVEEQIKQFKTTQNYGMNQVGVKETYDFSLSSEIISWSITDEWGTNTIYQSVIKKHILFKGIYPNANALGMLHLINYIPSYYPTRMVHIYGTEHPNELEFYYESFGESRWDYEGEMPPSFTETMNIIANMEGTVQIL